MAAKTIVSTLSGGKKQTLCYRKLGRNYATASMSRSGSPTSAIEQVSHWERMAAPGPAAVVLSSAASDPKPSLTFLSSGQ